TPTVAGMSYPDLARPVALYGSSVGADIRGGITYRGPIEDFQGYYFFGDASNEKLWRLTRAQTAFGSTVTSACFDNLSSILPVSSFPPVGPFMLGTDTRGNLYFGAIVIGTIGLPMNALYIVEPAP